MCHPLLRYRFAAITLLLLTSLLLPSGPANAWTPSQQPPLLDGASAQPPSMGYPAPPVGYPAPGYAPMPLQGSAPKMATSERPDSFAFAGMRLTRHHDDDTYRLDIQLNGLDPAQVEVIPAGHALAIIATRSAQTEREERFADGRGFQRSYSWSSGHSTKRLPVPPDADLAALRREDGDGEIHILIPRIVAGPMVTPSTPSVTPSVTPATPDHNQQHEQPSEHQ
jgi:HSP20 family molecular chaperone IbpA